MSKSTERKLGSTTGLLISSGDPRCTLPQENGIRGHRATPAMVPSPKKVISVTVAFFWNITSCWIWNLFAITSGDTELLVLSATACAQLYRSFSVEAAIGAVLFPNKSLAVAKIKKGVWPVKFVVVLYASVMRVWSCRPSPTPGRSIFVSIPFRVRMLAHVSGTSTEFVNVISAPRVPHPRRLKYQRRPEGSGG